MSRCRAAALLLLALVQMAVGVPTSWHRQQLGLVTHARLSGEHVHVVTAQGVVASVAAGSGELGAPPSRQCS